MPSLDEMPEDLTVKMLLIGPSGVGKTGSLASLALAGYNLRILDLDKGGIAPLKAAIETDLDRNVPRDPATVKAALQRVSYHSLTDTIRPVNGIPTVIGKPTAFSGIGAKLNDWGEGIGKLDTWTGRDILVIDSLTAVGDAAMRYVLFTEGRLNAKRPYQEDWGTAIGRLEALVEMLTDPYVKANVIIISHVKYVGGDDDEQESDIPRKGYPNALGKKLPSTMGRFFNTMVMADVLGSGAGAQRKIFARPQGKVDLKTARPGKTKPDYKLGSGLAELFVDLRGPLPPVPTPPPAAQ